MKPVLLTLALSSIVFAQLKPAPPAAQAKPVLDSVAKIVAVGQKGLLCSSEQSRLEMRQKEEQEIYNEDNAKITEMTAEIRDVDQLYSAKRNPADYQKANTLRKQLTARQKTVAEHDLSIKKRQVAITEQAACVKQTADSLNAILQPPADSKSTK